MKFFKKIKGVTLVEVLIAVGLFAVVATVSGNILVSIVQLEQKSSVQNAIYEDLRIILQQLTNEIQEGTIDYEEYYNYYVIQQEEKFALYGINYGVYGSRFYDPGKNLGGTVTRNPTDLGLECSYPENLGPGDECEVVYTLSVDLNTGQNPFVGDVDKSNAFCDGDRGQCPATGESDHLFLIDNSGTKKTLIARKKTGRDDYGIGLVRMEGMDLDQNGIIDTFSCMEEFNCFGTTEDQAEKLASLIQLPIINNRGDVFRNKITIPTSDDLETEFDISQSFETQFVPISPLRSDIQDLRFIINPVEDPYKAYAESKMQSHPSVTIILTIGLSEEAEEDYPGDFEPITVQTTVASGVIGRLDSYPPVNDIRDKKDPSWIKNVLGPLGLTSP
ncbi:hypothetical protein GF366_01780 [Candidatus Peregrinibacteria bacterium]|nr:hypothetical protein [Candidatus Peregrinibacteria bacterium]